MAVSVSVITATRNRTDLLERALRCIARQTFTDLEVIVSDDGSPSEVIEHCERVVQTFGVRFTMIKSAVLDGRGSGPGAARNRGARVARGEFLAFLDDDDQWPAQDYLETAIAALRENDADYFLVTSKA